jgi:hypothetical protein
MSYEAPAPWVHSTDEDIVEMDPLPPHRHLDDAMQFAQRERHRDQGPERAATPSG